MPGISCPRLTAGILCRDRPSSATALRAQPPFGRDISFAPQGANFMFAAGEHFMLISISFREAEFHLSSFVLAHCPTAPAHDQRSQQDAGPHQRRPRRRRDPPHAVITRRKNAAKLLRFRRGNLNFLSGKGSGNTVISSALGDRAPREQFCDLRLPRRCFFIVRTVCSPAFSLQAFRSIAVPAHNPYTASRTTINEKGAFLGFPCGEAVTA